MSKCAFFETGPIERYLLQVPTEEVVSFNLSRGGPNVIAEVQRWQYFLRRIGSIRPGRLTAILA